MILNVMRKVTLVGLLAVPVAMAATGCDEASSVAEGLCCKDFQPGANLNDKDWGLEGQAEVELKAFMQASADFSAASSALVSDLAVACQDLAVDLGASDYDITEQDPGKRAEQWCNKAAGLLKAKIAAAGNVTISAQPPVCNISASAKASCEANCSADASCQLTPGELPTCEGGELRFTCEGKCTGSCTGSAEVAVNCAATCSGTCNGKCEGTCSAQDGQGNCVGTCSGTCTGKCEGSCSASANADLQCEGECSGSCEGTAKAPKCTGGSLPKAKCQVSAQCDASCKASVQAKAECQPGAISVTGGLDTRTVAAIQGSLPRIRALLEGRVKLLADNIGFLAGKVPDVSASVTASAKATGCLTLGVVPALANATEQLVAAGRAGVNLSASITVQ